MMSDTKYEEVPAPAEEEEEEEEEEEAMVSPTGEENSGDLEQPLVNEKKAPRRKERGDIVVQVIFILTVLMGIDSCRHSLLQTSSHHHTLTTTALPTDISRAAPRSSFDATVQLHASNFEDFLQQNEYVFVHFSVSWSIWCQRLQPTWAKFANSQLAGGGKVAVAVVDCVAEADFCRQEVVRVYPTLRWFHNGKADPPDYRMERTVEAFKRFSTQRISLDQAKKHEREIATLTVGRDSENKKLKAQHSPQRPPTGPVNLTASNFDVFVQSEAYAFVEFMAPWCTYCQKVAPTWAEFADLMHATEPVAVGVIDCVAERELCSNHQVLAYPTFRWFHHGKVSNEDYKGDRTVQSFSNYVHGALRIAGKVPDEGRLNSDSIGVPPFEEEEVRGEVFREEKNHNLLVVEPAVEESTPSLKVAVELTMSNFDQFLSDNNDVFINFMSPSCIWSQRLEPTWERFAKTAKDNSTLPVAVANVNCNTEPCLCRRNKIMVFPTLRWFHKGRYMLPDFKCNRTVEDFIAHSSQMLNAEFENGEGLQPLKPTEQFESDKDSIDALEYSMTAEESSNLFALRAGGWVSDITTLYANEGEEGENGEDDEEEEEEEEEDITIIDDIFEVKKEPQRPSRSAEIERAMERAFQTIDDKAAKAYKANLATLDKEVDQAANWMIRDETNFCENGRLSMGELAEFRKKLSLLFRSNVYSEFSSYVYGDLAGKIKGEIQAIVDYGESMDRDAMNVLGDLRLKSESVSSVFDAVSEKVVTMSDGLGTTMQQTKQDLCRKMGLTFAP